MSNPFNYNLPVGPEQFVGNERWKLVDTIAARVRAPASQADSHLVVGGRRFGKTSVLLNLWHATMRTRRTNEEDYATLSVYVNGASIAELASGRGLFGAVLLRIKSILQGDRSSRDTPACPFRIDLSTVQWPDVSEPSLVTHDEFAAAICGLADAAEHDYGNLRVVLLLDEMERFLGKPWTSDFFGHLRSLIYDPDKKCRAHLCYVLAGSQRLLSRKETDEPGSALVNVLSPHLLAALEDDSTMEVIDRFYGLPDDVKRHVLGQGGGHPFLTQFLLHELWEKRADLEGAARITRQHVDTAAQTLRQLRRTDLEGWWAAAEDAGQRAYGVLASRSAEWVALSDIQGAIRSPNSGIQKGLETLAYHGVIRTRRSIRQDEPLEEYRVAGDLFRKWVHDYHLLPSDPEPIVTGVHLSDLEHWALECYEQIRLLEAQTVNYVADDPARLRRLHSQIEQHWAEVKRYMKEYLEIWERYHHSIPSDIQSIALKFQHDPDIGALVCACIGGCR